MKNCIFTDHKNIEFHITMIMFMLLTLIMSLVTTSESTSLPSFDTLYNPFIEIAPTWQTDLMSCVCNNCDEKLTVGVMVSGFCFYIYINDRIYADNDNVEQITNELKPINSNQDVLDGLVAWLSSDFYAKFRYPYINLNLQNSSFFTITGVKSGKTDPVLNIVNNTIIQSDKPQPAIIKTRRFELIFSNNKIAKNALGFTEFMKSKMNSSDILSSEHSTISRSYIPCNEKEGALIGNSKCVYFANEDVSCTIFSIDDSNSYDDFENFIIRISNEKISEKCKGRKRWGKCVLQQYANPYNQFILYLDPKLFKEYNFIPYFAVFGNKRGYYTVDVLRKRMQYFSSYENAVKALQHSDLKQRKHLCETGISMRWSHTSSNNMNTKNMNTQNSSNITVLSTTILTTTHQSKDMSKKTNTSRPVMTKATVLILILTGVTALLISIATCVYKRKYFLDCATRETAATINMDTFYY